MKKPLLIFILFFTVAQYTFAYDFKVNGIYYNIISSSPHYRVEVTKGHFALDTAYSGAILIPDTVTYDSITYSVSAIGMYAFSSCMGITSITLPNSITSIPEVAFYQCINLKSIVIPNSIVSIGDYAFMSCTALDSVIIPNSVRTIRKGAFENCTALTFITIPNLLTTIELGTFKNCKKLTSITIPASVKTIWGYAFAGCNELRKIIVECTIPPILEYYAVFENINDSVAIYVPCTAVSRYQTATGWSNFDNIMEGTICYDLTTIPNNYSMGSVTGGGRYDENSTIKCTAIPNTGYHFTHWNDGNRDNPRTITLTQDTVFIASFAEGEVGINNTGSENEVSIYPNPVQDNLTIRSSSIIEQVIIYDLNGKTVLSLHYPAQNINVSSLSKGLYMVKIKTEKGENRHKIVKE